MPLLADIKLQPALLQYISNSDHTLPAPGALPEKRQRHSAHSYRAANR